MKKILIVLGVIAVLGLGAFSWYQSTKNSLISMEENVNGSWAQVENQLQRRYDLIPNLVKTVKGYANQEKDIFKGIADARAKLAGSKTVADRVNASRGMESALSRLLVVVENYPNLKSDANFRQLMDELAGSENRLSVERKRYNDAVQQFNQTIRKFPTRIVAKQAGFSKKEFFQVEEKAKAAPVVDFD